MSWQPEIGELRREEMAGEPGIPTVRLAKGPA
jgi:hypothetical protein